MVGRDPAPLATEALRGEGATLINARASASCWRCIRSPNWRRATSSRAACSPRSPPAAARSSMRRKALGAHFAEHFPTVYASCIAAGIDPATQPIPVAPAAHYHMGGIAVDARGRTLDRRACGPAAKSPAPARMAPTGWPRTRCWKPWSMPRASPRISTGQRIRRRLPACLPRRSPRNCAMPPLDGSQSARP